LPDSRRSKNVLSASIDEAQSWRNIKVLIAQSCSPQKALQLAMLPALELATHGVEQILLWVRRASGDARTVEGAAAMSMLG